MKEVDTTAKAMAVCDPAESDRWQRLRELLVASWRRQLLEGKTDR
jgi:hypothetical protein